MATQTDWKAGEKVQTPFGLGIVVDCNVQNVAPCEQKLPRLCVKLSYGLLFTVPSVNPIHRIRTLVEIDKDLDVLEEGRRVKLEMDCADLAITCDHSVCKICLLQNEMKPSIFPLYKRSSHGKVFGMCIACGAPACQSHSVKEFRRESVAICSECDGLFHWRIDPEDAMLVKKVNSALQIYKRSYLLLESLAPGVQELVKKLNESSAYDATVDIGSSSVSFIAGAMGLVGAATILTPAGAPLLLASTVLGTSAATTRVSYSIGRRFRGEKPKTLANNIIASFGILRSLLTTLSVLVDEATSNEDTTKEFHIPTLANTGFAAAKAANTSLQVGQTLGATESASVFQYLGAAPVIGQVFSVAAMTMDLNTVSSTLAKIRSGNRNEKADKVEHLMMHEFVNLPSFNDVNFAAHELLLTHVAPISFVPNK